MRMIFLETVSEFKTQRKIVAGEARRPLNCKTLCYVFAVLGWATDFCVAMLRKIVVDRSFSGFEL